MSQKSKWDYLKAIFFRYQKVSNPLRVTHSRRVLPGLRLQPQIRHPIARGPAPQKTKTHPKGSSPDLRCEMISALAAIWEAAGFPCSARSRPFYRCGCRGPSSAWLCRPKPKSNSCRSVPLPSTADSSPKSANSKNRLYGRTKPGTLLKHHIPIKTDSWNVKTPGFTETDLVSHSGNSASGEFIHSLNVTDIHSTWVETERSWAKARSAYSML